MWLFAKTFNSHFCRKWRFMITYDVAVFYPEHSAFFVGLAVICLECFRRTTYCTWYDRHGASLYPSGSIVLAIWNSIRLTKPRLKGRPARNAKSSPAPGNVYTAGQMHNARVETPKKAFLFVVSDCDLAPRFYLLGRWRMHGIFGSLARKR
jgi:hypothetical protein